MRHVTRPGESRPRRAARTVVMTTHPMSRPEGFSADVPMPPPFPAGSLPPSQTANHGPVPAKPEERPTCPGECP